MNQWPSWLDWPFLPMKPRICIQTAKFRAIDIYGNSQCLKFEKLIENSLGEKIWVVIEEGNYDDRDKCIEDLLFFGTRPDSKFKANPTEGMLGDLGTGRSVHRSDAGQPT